MAIKQQINNRDIQKVKVCHLHNKISHSIHLCQLYSINSPVLLEISNIGIRKMRLFYVYGKILFKDLIYLSIFEPKCWSNLIHKCRLQKLTIKRARLLCCYCKYLTEWSLLSYKWKFFNCQDKEGVRARLLLLFCPVFVSSI